MLQSMCANGCESGHSIHFHSELCHWIVSLNRQVEQNGYDYVHGRGMNRIWLADAGSHSNVLAGGSSNWEIAELQGQFCSVKDFGHCGSESAQVSANDCAVQETPEARMVMKPSRSAPLAQLPKKPRQCLS